VSISITGLHDFCQSRRITKGGRKQETAEARRPSKTARSVETTAAPITDEQEGDEWDLVVPKTLSTWKSRGEDRPPPRNS